jgi:hypothetical protein
MVQRKDDNTPPPPGGRAAERLRQFTDARSSGSDVEQDPGQVQPSEEKQPEQVPDPPCEAKAKQRDSQSS